MGIRVHKQMGYGLSDLAHDEKGYKITDPRINAESKLFDLYDTTVEEYVEWLKSQGREEASLDAFALESIERSGIKLHMSDTFAWQGEFGLPNVLVLTPLTMKDWRRYDDGIDYAVETYLWERDEDQQTNRVDHFGHGLYPWNGLHMDARTGVRIDSNLAMAWVRTHWPNNKPDETKKLQDGLALAMGFEDRHEAERCVVPWVPEEIQDLARFGELFTDENVWTQLRPMLYTYWS